MQDNCCPTKYRLRKVNLTPNLCFYVLYYLILLEQLLNKTHMKMMNRNCIYFSGGIILFTISFISVPPQLSDDLVDFIHLHIMVTHYSSTNYIAKLLS